MVQQSLEKYVIESAIKIADKIGNGDDSISICILLYLAREEVSPIYELENFLVGYLSTEEEIITKTRDLNNVGLIEIYDGRMVTNGTTIIRLTPLGKEVGRILESNEIRNGYPITKKILSDIIFKRLKQKNPFLKMNGFEINLNKNEITTSDEIEYLIKNDQISSRLMNVYSSI